MSLCAEFFGFAFGGGVGSSTGSGAGIFVGGGWAEFARPEGRDARTADDVETKGGPAVEATYSLAAEPSGLGSEDTPSSSPARSTRSSSAEFVHRQLANPSALKIGAVPSSGDGSAGGGI